MKKEIAIIGLLLLLCGCGSQNTELPEATAAPSEVLQIAAATEVAVTMPPAVASEAAAMVEAPPPAVSVVLEAEASGERETRGTDAVIDYSHTEDGYIMARYTSRTDKRLKFRVFGPTTTYTYDLPVDQWTVFPLSDGNGTYQVTLYINTHDTKYAAVMSTQFDVLLADEFAPFLRNSLKIITIIILL